MNGAQLIAEILKREGTEFLSCYPRNPLIEACAAIDIHPILCRQERVGVGLADGYTRIKRGKRNGVFAAQTGPGIENAFPGIAQRATALPILQICRNYQRRMPWRAISRTTAGRMSSMRIPCRSIRRTGARSMS